LTFVIMCFVEDYCDMHQSACLVVCPIVNIIFVSSKFDPRSVLNFVF